MKNADYRTFKRIIAHAEPDNEIWWAGYYWMDLTGKQCRDMIELLETKPFIVHAKTPAGKDALKTPSGIMIAY